MAKMTKRDLITTVSKRTNLRRDVVEDVLEGIVDTAIEEIVNTGEFTLKDLFSVTFRNWKGYSLAGTNIKPQKRLSVRLSGKIKRLWKLKNEKYSTTGYLSREQLEKALRFDSESSSKKDSQVITPNIPSRSPIVRPPAPKVEIPKDTDNYYNPMLDEDDGY